MESTSYIPRVDQTRLKSAVKAALRNRYTTAGSTEENLLAFLLLVQREREQQDNVSPDALRLATNTVLDSALAQLASQNEELSRILKMRFQDGEQIRSVAIKLNMAEPTVSHKQRDALDEIVRLLLDEEVKAWREQVAEMEGRLPPPSYDKLFGVDEQIATMVAKLLAEGEPWITAVSGIGGIGKTSLAHAVTMAVIQRFRFANAVWVRLESASTSGRFTSPEQLQDTLLSAISDRLWPEQGGDMTPHGRSLQVRQALKEQPILIVVDNLESPEDMSNLLAYLQDLVNPSKFLLTSRTRPTGAFQILLDELPLAAATALVRHQIQTCNIEGAANLSDDDIADIYERTGGNPLALKLIINLLEKFTLTHILDDLKSVNIEKVEELYRHIYWQNWETISEAARTLLQAMVIVPREGSTLAYLKTISGLAEQPLRRAISELSHRSLLDVVGDAHSKYYSIHPLTKSFVKAEIIRWPADPSSEPPPTAD